MKRRTLLLAPLTLAAMTHAPAVHAQSAKVQSMTDVLRWLDAMERAPSPKTTGTWPLPAVLEHLAQSIEMSVRGFPAPRSALFQSTLGTAAFTVFKWRGRMSHGLAEPIPGAPALALQGDWRVSAQRLRQAIGGFQAASGPLKPHFAYGTLSRADYALAHSMHIANHQDEIAVVLAAGSEQRA